MSSGGARSGHVEQAYVHFDDLDAFGAVHHARVPVIVERATFAYFDRLGYPFGHPDASALVGELGVRYEAPITGVGPVDVRLWVERLGTASIATGFQLSRGTDLLATGSRILIKIDPRTRRPAPWSDQFRKTFAAEGLLG